MKAAPLPVNEAQRLQALRRYQVLDTAPEAAFDELTGLAAQLCGAPIGLMTLLDEQRLWCKSRVGLETAEMPREGSFSAWAILQEHPLVVEDARRDERFAGHPLVKGEAGVRFAAVAPLITPEDLAIGGLCVLDREPRGLRADQAEGLRILSRQVMTQLELRRSVRELARNIEEHKRTEDRLRNSEAFYQTLVDTLPQNILRKDSQGRFTFANKKFCHSIGKPLYEIIGKTDADFFPGELAQKYHRDDQRVMGSLENLETTEAHVTPQGEELVVHVIKSPLYDALGRVIGIQGIFWDVTQGKRMEEALAYERDLLKALLGNIPDRIYYKDLQSRFLRCSQSMAERLGLKDAEAVVGKTDFDFHAQELAREFYEDEQRIITTGQPLINKLERQFDVAGREIWASVTKVPIYSHTGAVTGIIGISRDVTQLKQAEGALKQARDAALELARVKTEFLANMSHEIRTPMNAITGMTSLLQDTRLTQEQAEYVGTIRDSTDTLLGIINDILDFSKIEAGKLSLEVIDFELRDAVESTVEMLAENAQKKGIELNCWLAPEVPNLVRGDPGRFRQVLANLLSNAVKFTDKGEVLVRVSRLEESETHVTVYCAVKDTGVGIAEEAMGRIFKAFTQADGSTTRKYGGTGLGLTISKQLVELMRGEIGVESVPGQGSTFWFKLPLEKQAAGGQVEREFESGDLTGLRVLVVDDTKTQCRILREQLSGLRLQVLCAASGTEALAQLRREAEAGRPVQIVISDLENAEMDGLSLAQRIKEGVPGSTRLVVLSTLGQRLNTAALRSTGIAGCLVKPVRQSRLYDCLVEVMSARQSSDLESAREVRSLSAGTERKHARILLAEDNIVNQRLALRQLRKLGYQADAVSDGKEVLDALKRVPYEIILMDCHMPEIDGYEASHQIRAAEQSSNNPFKASPYIIALTANAMQGDRDKCLASGMNDYLTKPLHLGNLGSALERASLKVGGAPRMESSSGQPVLDPAVIAGLRGLKEPNQPDPLKELADLFQKDGEMRLGKLEEALGRQDAGVLAMQAHTLKGSANNLGARRLAELCQELEKAGKVGNLTEAANILLAIRSAFQQVEQVLSTELEKPV